MTHLIGVTVLWAFSFSLIGVYLAADVDSYFAVLTRVALATVVFLPVLDWRRVAPGLAARLMAIGAVQLGVMYIFFYHAFLFLSVPEVLLFTIFTPIYVTLIYDALNRRFSARFLVTAALAVAGAAVIRYQQVSSDFVLGFLLVQGANLSFALGQVAYKHVMARADRAVPNHAVFGFFFIGALLVAAPAFLLFGDWTRLPETATQWGVLLWLGVVASGLGYFLWNTGATRVNAGALAVMNNALIPAGLIVNVMVWNRDAALDRLAVGGLIIVASLIVNEIWARQRTRTVARI
jgi:carboxylate/amino acid/amine transporter